MYCSLHICKIYKLPEVSSLPISAGASSKFPKITESPALFGTVVFGRTRVFSYIVYCKSNWILHRINISSVIPCHFFTFRFNRRLERELGVMQMTTAHYLSPGWQILPLTFKSRNGICLRFIVDLCQNNFMHLALNMQKA